ncbi:MAG: DUF4837 family protein [Bacteroidales bacterium]|jgi:hypothetical protein|nr:DUF4837 family protein [Bacteroidales bacterium]MDY0160919.1 DUF4837 family protein [Bacteroidales bacterium]
MIKKIYFILTIIIISISFSCKNAMMDLTPGATGNPGEILVVLNDNIYYGEIGDSLKAIFHQECPNLPMEEYLFNLVQIPQEKFIDLNKRHRNVIYPIISRDVSNAAISVSPDKYAKNQMYVKIAAPNQEEFIKLLNENQEILIELFKKADRDRWLFYYNKYQINSIREIIERDHNVSFVIPKSYTLDVNKDNFAWISFESRTASIGILVYHYPFRDTNTFTLDYLINKRNEILKENVPGPREGSYMTTETHFDIPTFKAITHNETYTAYIRGLWKVEGDFMGGPFVSYTKADTARNRIVTVEGFVYNPNQEVRNEIRKLETILYTMEIK